MRKTVAIAAVAALMVSCGTAGRQEVTDYTQYVDPMIGTGGHGHTFPGAVTPHGMIQPSPDTRYNGWDACSGYYIADTLLNGFTQNHLSGTGCADYGDFLIIPTTGKQVVDPQIDTLQNLPYASAFSHADEVAEPGYYSTYLKRYGVKAEIAAADRAAIYRFTFPKSDDAGFIVDLDYDIQGQNTTDMSMVIEGDTAVNAYKLTRWWAFDQQIYVHAVFSKPFKYEMLSDTITDSNGNPKARLKALIKFPDTTEGEEIYVKVAVSAVDADGARKNLEAEMPGWDFDGTRAEAKRKWNETLSAIDITADNDSDRTIFYTALYHTAISPNLFTDADGRYLGMDRKPHQGDTAHPVYTVFSLWDTHRALHPLLTIIDPELNNDFINSLLLKAEEGGILPMWELAGNYTACMTGYHAVSVMADALAKGTANFDAARALKAARRASRRDTSGICAPQACIAILANPGKEYKDKIGYIPWDKENESVAKGLEYAYNDWCISRIAEEAGDTAAYLEFKAKGQNYRNYFDPETRFMRGKDLQGKWHEPFNPFASNHRADDYCEGTGWQWAWFVPHDVPGLIRLMGGKEKFAEKLDSLFTVSSKIEGSGASADISGLIGQYAHGNEPSHHIIHLFNYAGCPERTQELADQALREMYTAQPDGLSGNEDCGQMSAWYVLNSLGFYQVAPGSTVYSIGRPWFPQASVRLPGGKSIEIKVNNYSKANKYIKSVKLNGTYLLQLFFTHGDIRNGAVFEYEMTDQPQTSLTIPEK